MKSHPLSVVSVVAVLVMLFSTPAFAALSNKDREAIEKAHAAATKPASMNPGKIDWVTFVDAHYSPDAKLLPPNSPMVSGREALIAFFKSFPPLAVFKTSDLEVDGDGDTAYIRGSYEITMNPPNSAPVTDKGKCVEIWRRRGGTWRCVMDVFNADMPGK